MQKILLILSYGVVIGLSKSKTTAYFAIKNLHKELRKIDKKCLQLAINNLYRSKLIDFQEKNDGTQILTLTENGKKRVLVYNFEKLKFKKQQNWDGLWRVISFDIPEKFRKERNALSQKLKSAGAYPLQKSVFVYPYDIKDELDFLIEFLNLRRYVRCIIAKDIDNNLHLKKIFGLI
ncbi:MAG: hypothetical protein QXG91_03860 [Candidatus Aenigmatarchaeota archaeon]